MKNQFIFFIIGKNIISKNSKTFLLSAPGNFSRKMYASPNGLFQPGANTATQNGKPPAFKPAAMEYY